MLNLDQQKAINNTEGPVRIIAGAGTGKTRTLIARIAHLIKEKKAEPEKILAISFTNKAAHAINEKLLEKGLTPINSLTFNTLSALLIRKYRESELTDHKNLTLALLEMWKEQPETLLKCQNDFSYILADDYQDINSTELDVLKKLAKSHKNICVAGDADQTICSHLGAKTETMTKFEHVFQNTVPISLSKNYRSPQNILKGAENLISKNIGRLKKPLRSISGEKGNIFYWESGSGIEKMEMITHIIRKSAGAKNTYQKQTEYTEKNKEIKNLEEIALLYRTYEEGLSLARELDKRGIPYQSASNETFWRKKEVIDFLEGIESLSKWTNIAQENFSKFSKWIKEKLEKFIQSQNYNKTTVSLLNHLIKYTEIYDHLPVEEALEKFLDTAKTQQDPDNIIQKGKLNLLSLHSSKGMEFPIVIIVGLEEGNLPHKESLDEPYWLAEERRLLYVGMTRATEELHLIYNKRTETEDCKPSRFLKEIGLENMEKGLISQIKIKQIEKREVKRAQMKLF